MPPASRPSPTPAPPAPLDHQSIETLVNALMKPGSPGHRDTLRSLQGGGHTLAAEWLSFFGQAIIGTDNSGTGTGTAQGSRAISTDSVRAQLSRLNDSLLRKVKDNGITFNLYADQVSQSHPWSLDLLPFIIGSDEWKHIERGVLQRTQLLNSVLADTYGPQCLINEGLLPAALVKGHPGYVRAAHGIKPMGGTYLHVAAFDLACDAAGQWWVMSQKLQAPSGLGYALENRIIVSRLFTDAFRSLKVERMVNSYKALIASLTAHSKAGSDSRVVLLTPGPYSSTYFEHVYLAKYLGLNLVEGGDLVVRNRRVWLKTLQGLEPVDVILRHLDDSFLDPLELRADSAIGVPGLMEAYRAGNVVLANAPGAGFLESAAVLGFMPSISRALMNEDLLLPSAATWWCGEKAVLRTVLPNLGDYVIKSTYNDPARRFASKIGHSLSSIEREQWSGKISMRPEDYSVQAYLPLSHHPSWDAAAAAAGGKPITPRAAMIRVFAVSDGPCQWRIVPGALVRLAPEGKDIVSMQRGGSSADLWAITGRGNDETRPISTTLTPISVQRPMLGIASRAAENLFWFGRYTERLENSTRLARIALEALTIDAREAKALEWLSKMAVSNGLVNKAVPSALKSPALFERSLIASLSDTENKLGAYSIAATLASLKFSAYSVRERLASEQWSMVSAAAADFEAAVSADSSALDAVRALERLSQQVMAMTGAQTDRMTRDDGWRLLSIGRHLERQATLSEALAEALRIGVENSEQGFAFVLSLFDSTITYRSRYLQRMDLPALIELLVLDRENPRALAWVSSTLQSRIAKMTHMPNGVRPPFLMGFNLPHEWQADEVLKLAASSAAQDQGKLIALLTLAAEDTATISDAISQRYFSHAATHSVGV